MRIHELLEDAKLTKEGLEYLSELDERINEENKNLLDEIKCLQAEKEELRHTFSFQEGIGRYGWRTMETKTRGEVVDELHHEIDEYLARIEAHNNKSWLSKLLSINKII